MTASTGRLEEAAATIGRIPGRLRKINFTASLWPGILAGAVR